MIEDVCATSKNAKVLEKCWDRISNLEMTALPRNIILKCDVLIIGGGFSGTILAVQLLRQSRSASIAIIEPTSLPGCGLAYSSPYKCHLLNMPAVEMSAFPNSPYHFLDWARTHFHPGSQERSFLPRFVYGRYVGHILESTQLERGADRFRWLRDKALSVRPCAEGFAIGTDSGLEILTRVVVLAIGSSCDAGRGITDVKPGSSTYFDSPHSHDALDNLRSAGNVLLLGSDQPSVDLILTLKAKRFRGTIHVLSRKGLFPHARRESRSHEKWPIFWNYRSPRTVRRLLRLVRAEAKLAYSRGVDWRQVIDALAPVTQRMWQSLPLQEKKRFVRHVRVFWDAHYDCIAPEIWDLLQDMREEGQVVVHRGALCEYRDTSDGAEVKYRDALNKNETVLRVSRVINCESPDAKPISFHHPVLNSLHLRGLAQPHALQLGLDVDKYGRLISRDGIASRCLYAIGRLRKGALWETTTVRDIRRQAIEMAGHLIEFIEPQPSVFRRAIVKSQLSSRNQRCSETTDTFSD